MRRTLLTPLLLLGLAAGSLFAADYDEQVFAEMNFARTQPRAYAQIVAERGAAIGNSPRAVAEAVRYLRKQKAVPALGISPGLAQAALSHVLDCGPRGIRGHRGSDGSHVSRRADRFGRWEGRIAENISFGRFSPRDTVVFLIIDEGVGDRGHRLNIFQKDFQRVGVASGAHASYGLMVVTNFAAEYRERYAVPVASR